ncbi:MAG TPA: PAS domain-containing protein [Ignavibacteria bacterium]
MEKIENIAERIESEIKEKDIYFAWQLDDKFNIIEISDGVSKILGYYPNEIISTNFTDYMLKQEARFFLKEISDYNGKYKSIFNITNIFKRKDKTHIVLETKGKSLSDNDGNITGFEGLTFYR